MSEAARSRKSHVAPALVPLERVLDDAVFQVRLEGDVSLLATDMARLGQLFPVDLRLKPPDRFQVICGFRRIQALRFLKSDKVLARLHTDLSEADATLMALTAAIHQEPVSLDDLSRFRGRLEEEDRLSAEAEDMITRALAQREEVEGGEKEEPASEDAEVDAADLARDVTLRLADLNQDLSLLADVFEELDPPLRKELLGQLGYAAELLGFLGRRP